MTRVMIYGPRDFDDRRMLKVVLDQLHERLRFTVVIETDEPGLARMAGDWGPRAEMAFAGAVIIANAVESDEL